ncbi:hypothetical protein O3M35_013262 [Rhynocoris fuscipes]|uniref:Uncharacterized protein n=1 Tax=Rhynocoris fuscipes TaxID=488301 RepID=A0AAW1CGB4_9HEMI
MAREGLGARLKRRWSELGRRGRYDLSRRPQRGLSTICGDGESPEPRIAQGFRVHTSSIHEDTPPRLPRRYLYSHPPVSSSHVHLNSILIFQNIFRK